MFIGLFHKKENFLWNFLPRVYIAAAATVAAVPQWGHKRTKRHEKSEKLKRDYRNCLASSPKGASREALKSSVRLARGSQLNQAGNLKAFEVERCSHIVLPNCECDNEKERTVEGQQENTNGETNREWENKSKGVAC